MSNKADPRFQRLCPMLWTAIHGRRYLLPRYRQGDYENQETLNDMFQRSLIATATGKKDDEVQFDNLVSALRHDRPILFLERELGEAFARTQLPADMNTTDVRWKWPQLRIMMPLGLCTIERNNASRSLSFLDICRIDSETTSLSEKYQAELEHYLQRIAPTVYANPARRT